MMSQHPVPSWDIEQDYEAYYKHGWRPDPYSDHGTIPVGYLYKMCGEEEMQERQRQKRLTKYEIKPGSNPPEVDSKLAMKEFSRSAAGREFSHASNLRPWSILRQGLHHLLLDICLRNDDWMYISGFVFDRLKSIRQDMIIQQIEGRRCIEILEGSVRFLVYSMYRLTCATRDYTNEQSMRVILSPKGEPVSGLNNYEINVVREMKLTMQCLRDCLQSLIVQYQDFVPDSPNRYLFEAICMIVNIPQLIGHRVVSTDLMSKKELRDEDPMFKTVFRMRRDHVDGFHVSALKRLPTLKEHPLIILTYASVLPLLQMNIITRLKRAYASRGPNRSPPDHLCRLICPEWLDISYDERIIFTYFVALQFGIYNDSKNVIEFKSANHVIKEPVDWIHQKLPEQEDSDNETRIFAMQMILGREWSFFSDTIKLYGVESVLDPRQ